MAGLVKKKRLEDDSAQDCNDWDDHQSYMRVKKRKLDDQFHGMGYEKRSSIFEGVTIYVNGWTQPNADELKHMIFSHGGSYVFNLYGNMKVTHTIATNLPNSKIKNLGDSVVCTPNWIVDSIAAGYKLPVETYQLYSNRGKGQKRLNTFKTSPTAQYFDSVMKAAPKELLASCESATTSDVVANKEMDIGNPSSKQADGCKPSMDKSIAHNDICSSKTSNQIKLSKSNKVSEFFAHSRLHYLSTWSTELKQYTAKMVTKIHPKYSKLPSNVSLRAQQSRAIVHIDLDCFFVSVSIRNKPHLKSKPVAVTHAKNNEELLLSTAEESSKSNPSRKVHGSTSDIASCSYEARKHGVYNGMSVGAAVKLCPELILLPYDFSGYRQVSQVFYETLLLYSSIVEAVSCDEAYIDLSDFADSFDGVEKLVKEIRIEIETKTGCTVSAGISHNMLLARISTRSAKPNGQFYLPLERVQDFLAAHKVRDLPGVGYSMAAKLREINIETCADLKKMSLTTLRHEFGEKTGMMLYNFCRGVDMRELKQSSERKSVSVDMNFGIRFTEISEAKSLIESLAEELERRAEDAGVVGGTITLKMKTRRQDAPRETWKHLGHGACDNVTRSITLLEPTRTAANVSRMAIILLNQVKPTACDIRGMGLQLTKLVSTIESQDSTHSYGTDIRKIFQTNTRSSKLPEEPSSRRDISSTSGSFASADLANDSFLPDLPPQSQLDSSVLRALPTLLQDKILKSYSENAAVKPVENAYLNDYSVRRNIPPVPYPTSPNPDETYVQNVVPDEISAEPSSMLTIACSEAYLIDDEDEFVCRLYRYISDWITNSLEGPDDDDIEIFTHFLLKLLKCNLEVVSLALKYIRSTILKLQLPKWYASFDKLLFNMQDSEDGVQNLYAGKLLIDSIVQNVEL